MAQDFKVELSEPSETQSEHLEIQICALTKWLNKPHLLFSNMLGHVISVYKMRHLFESYAHVDHFTNCSVIINANRLFLLLF